MIKKKKKDFLKDYVKLAIVKGKLQNGIYEKGSYMIDNEIKDNLY